MEKKTIFVAYEKQRGINDYFAAAQARGLCFPLFRGLERTSFSGKIRRVLIDFALRFHLNFLYRRLLGDWTKKLSELTSIVFTASRSAIPALDFLQQHYPQMKRYVFYLNPLKNEVARLSEWAPYDCEILTFDVKDAEMFDLKQIQQPICREYFEKTSNDKPVWDIVFVGEDKKRLPQLLALKASLDAQAISSYFHITSTYPPYQTPNSHYPYAQPIAYQEVIHLYAQSQAIVEILQEGQKGSTMRAIEAGYLGKKLITTNTDIIKQRYYHPNNIFLLSADNAAAIPAFLKKPFWPGFGYDSFEMEFWLKKF
jgi:hypothetical protein